MAMSCSSSATAREATSPVSSARRRRWTCAARSASAARPDPASARMYSNTLASRRPSSATVAPATSTASRKSRLAMASSAWRSAAARRCSSSACRHAASGATSDELLERPAAPQATGLTDEGQSRVGVGRRRPAGLADQLSGSAWRPARRAPVAAGSRRRRSRVASPPRPRCRRNREMWLWRATEPEAASSSGQTAATRLSTLAHTGRSHRQQGQHGTALGSRYHDLDAVDREPQRSEHLRSRRAPSGASSRPRQLEHPLRSRQ